MRSGLVASLVVFLFAVSGRAYTSEAFSFPNGIGTIITLRSAQEVLRSATAYSEEAGVEWEKMSPVLKPVGLHTLAILSDSSGEKGGEWYVLTPLGASPFREHAVWFPVADFTAFRERLAGHGGVFRTGNDGMALLVTVPGGKEYYVEAVGDNRVILAMSPDLLFLVRRLIQEGRLPAHKTKGAIGIRHTRSFDPEYTYSESGPNASLLSALVDIVLHACSDIILKTTMLEMDVSLGAKQIFIQTRVHSQPGSLLDTMANAPGVESMVNPIPSNGTPMVVSLNAPLIALFPALRAFGDSRVASILERDYKEHGTDLVRIVRDLINHGGDGKSVIARYMGTQGGYYVIWLETESPDKIMTGLQELFTTSGVILNAENRGLQSIDVLSIEKKQTPHGIPFIHIQPSDIIKKQVLEGAPFLPSLGAGALSVAGALSRLSLFITTVNDRVMIMTGLAGESDFVALADAQNSLSFDWEHSNILTAMNGSRFVTVLLDPSALYLESIENRFSQLKALETICGFPLPDDAQKFADAYDKVRPTLYSDGHYAGIGLSKVGVLSVDISIPADVVGQLERNIQAILSILEVGNVSQENENAFIKGNEHAAISALKMYLQGQVMYSVFFKSGYTTDFRLLHDAERKGEKISLIPEGMSRARIGHGCLPANGYVFLEDPAVSDWRENCALIAYPEKFGITGTTTFWIDSAGLIRKRVPQSLPGVTPIPYAAEESPLNNPDAWEEL